MTKIGYDIIDANNHFNLVAKYLKQAAEQAGIQVTVSDANVDGVRQVNQIEDMVNSGAQVVIAASVDPKAIEAAVTYAHNHGVKVISDISGFAGADAYVGLDECGWGTEVGDYVGTWWAQNRAGQQANIWEANADSLGGDLPKRTDCMIDAFKKHVPTAKVSIDLEAWLEDTGYKATLDVMTSHPDVNLIFGTNTVFTAGAISALKSTGRKPGKDVFLACVDWDARLLQEMRAGEVLASAYTNERGEGPILLDVAQKLMAGTYPLGSHATFPTPILTPANIDTVNPG